MVERHIIESIDMDKVQRETDEIFAQVESSISSSCYQSVPDEVIARLTAVKYATDVPVRYIRAMAAEIQAIRSGKPD